MKLGTTITLVLLLSGALGVPDAGAQPVPCDSCNSCESCELPPCGCAGHEGGCCCDGLCRQAPPNPLAPGRPSPPPCCADGICYPNPETWGHYGTRWRRWPIELAAATPAGAATPARPSPDVPKYDVLPPEEEDRRAPPPSVTRGKPVEIGPRQAPKEGEEEAAPARPTSPTTPSSPTTPQDGAGTDLSPESIFGAPPESAPPAGAPSLGAPPEETPRTAPLTPPQSGELPPLDEPMGDMDLPPALPFATRKMSKQPAARSTDQPATTSPRGGVRTAPQDDPPPAPPAALASVSR